MGEYRVPLRWNDEFCVFLHHWKIIKNDYVGIKIYCLGLSGRYHGRDLSGLWHRQVESAAQALAHSGERVVGIGGHWRQCRGVVGDAGLAPQDPAQEVQVRRAGDIRGAGGGGGVVAVGELGELSELCVFITAGLLFGTGTNHITSYFHICHFVTKTLFVYSILKQNCIFAGGNLKH